jgi:hypothetical protein
MKGKKDKLFSKKVLTNRRQSAIIKTRKEINNQQEGRKQNENEHQHHNQL